jgi:exonuclease III
MKQLADTLSLKIGTYNVHGIYGRLHRLLEWLAETSPDVVCLQEIKMDDSKFPIEASDGAGYGAVWHGQRLSHGVAILAKGEKPTEIRRGRRPRVSRQGGRRRLCSARVALSKRPSKPRLETCLKKYLRARASRTRYRP